LFANGFLIDVCIVLIAYLNLLYHLKLWRNSSVDCHLYLRKADKSTSDKLSDVDLSSFLRYNFNNSIGYT